MGMEKAMMDMRTCGSVAVSRATAARHIVGKHLLFIIYYRAVYMIYMIYMEAASALASVRLPTSSVCLKESKSACEHDTPERTDAMICGHTHTHTSIYRSRYTHLTTPAVSNTTQ